ncbi:MAG: GNAT family N-acetyltransferase [Ilumatobacteraceae bacterium]
MERLPSGTVTPRLTLRVWAPEDAPAVCVSVDESMDHLRSWMAWAVEPVTVEHFQDVIDRFEASWRDGVEASYGVFLDGEVIGGTGLHRRAGPDTLEIGYWIHVDHIGRGYATEVSAALTDLAFTVDGVDHVEIHHDEANVRSAAVPRKLGFAHVATAPRERLAPAHSGIEWIWRVDRADWLAARARARRDE